MNVLAVSTRLSWAGISLALLGTACYLSLGWYAAALWLCGAGFALAVAALILTACYDRALRRAIDGDGRRHRG